MSRAVHVPGDYFRPSLPPSGRYQSNVADALAIHVGADAVRRLSEEFHQYLGGHHDGSVVADREATNS